MREAPLYDSPVPPPRKRRVLFFAYYYPPLGGAGSNRALSFARELPRHGWEVHVVTPKEGVFGTDGSLSGDSLEGTTVHRTGTYEPSVLLRRFRRSVGGGAASPGMDAYVEEARLGLIGGTVRSLARRLLYFPDSSRGWVYHAVKAAHAAHRRAPFDLILSSSPPVSAHVAAERFAEATGVPWIADWRDFWSHDARSGGLIGARAVALEKKLMAGAAGLAGATEGVTRLLGGLLGRPDRSVTVRNGYDPADFASPAPEVVRACLVYTGTLYGKSEQDPAELFRALRSVRDSGNAPAAFRVRVLGKVDSYASSLAASLGIGGLVEFEGFKDHAESIRAMRSASLLLLLGSLRTSEAGMSSVPAKTYEYLASGRPILALGFEGSELQSVLGGAPGVRFVNPRDEDAIAAALVEHLSGAGLQEGVPAARALRYSRVEAAGKLAALMETVQRPAGNWPR